MTSRTCAVRGAVAIMLVSALVGCDGEPPMEDAGDLPDAGPPIDAPSVRDAGRPCESDEDCDDGVDCTMDICGPTGFCRNTSDPSFCDDGIFCNGVERCDPVRGCIAGERITCNDDDVCTIDVCDEEGRTCRYFPRDLDEDGDPDWFCEGGGDCDDRNPAVSSLVDEVCANLIDDNCNGLVDELPCSPPRHDTCDDPLDVSEGGYFELTTNGANPDYALSCGVAGRRDVVASFTIETRRSVDIEAEGDFFSVSVALQSECGELASELDCRSGFDPRIRRLALDPGDYYILAAAAATGEIGLRVTFGDPVDPPPNNTCASPTPVGAGGNFSGTFIEVSDSVATTCGFSGAPDLFYELTLAEEQDVVINAIAVTGEAMTWALRSACEDQATETRCAYGNPASGRVHRLPAGTWYLVVEGPTFRSVDFDLSVTFEDPTDPPPGDACSTAIDLPIGETVTGTLADKQDLVPVSCGFRYRDAVYRFTLPQAADVEIEANHGGFANFSLRSVCDDASTQIRCVAASPPRALIRDLPAGEYFLILESSRTGGFTVRVDSEEASEVVEVFGNDDCDDAVSVPLEGGIFRGDTSALTNSYTTTLCGAGSASPDAAFRLDLPEARRVVADTSGSTFDTILHVHSGACASEGEVFCDDSSGDGFTSRIDRELAAGTWYFIVDGWAGASSGEYTIQFTITDP